MSPRRSKEKQAAQESATAAPRKQPAAEKKIVKTARSRWKQWEDSDSNQIQRELDDLRFANLDQWPADVKASRAGQSQAANGLPPTPARPCLVLDMIGAATDTVLNQERQMDFGIEISEADDFGLSTPIDDSEIELREGIVRRVQRESEAAHARTWAFDRAVKAGRGYYGIGIRFAEGKTFDQEVYIKHFYNQAAIAMDPAHEQPDGADAEWGFEGEDYQYSRYVAEYGELPDGEKNPAVTDDEEEWRGLGDEAPGWFFGEGDARGVRVTNYYYVEHRAVDIALLPNGQIVELKDVPKGVTPVDTRRWDDRRVMVCKIDGLNILEGPIEWEGRYIPLVKVVGKEVQPYDKEKRVHGIVRPARDAQQGRNFTISKAIEDYALTPTSPLMMAEGQDEPYKHEYAVMNTRNLPVLHYKQTDLEGRPAPPPFRPPKQTNIGESAAFLQIFSNALKDATHVPDPTLGNVDPALKSGKAIAQVLQQAQMGTSNYLDNLKRSMRHEGRIVNDLLYPVYGRRKGRMARLMQPNGESKRVMVNQPFQRQGEKIVPAQQPQGEGVEHYQLTEGGAFNVAIKVAKAFDTRREAESALLGTMIEARPELLGVFGDEFFKNLDGPGHDEMAERMRVMLDPKVLAYLESQKNGQTPVPPQLLAQLQQMDQALKELQQRNQELESGVAAKKIEAEVQLQKAQLEHEVNMARVQVDAAKVQSQGEIATQKHATALQSTEMAETGETQRVVLKAQLAAEHADREREHETALRASESAQDSVQS